MAFPLKLIAMSLNLRKHTSCLTSHPASPTFRSCVPSLPPNKLVGIRWRPNQRRPAGASNTIMNDVIRKKNGHRIDLVINEVEISLNFEESAVI